MKRCPTCGRAYHDDTINFCLEDGSVLSAPPYAAETLALPNRQGDNLAPTVPAAPSEQPSPLREEPTIPVGVQSPQAFASGESPRRKGGLLWLIPVATVLLVSMAAILFYAMSEKKGGGGETNGGGREVETPSNRNVTATPSGTVIPTTPQPTATPEATPTPMESGFIKGVMAYPSDGIPGEMVACAENLETKETACTNRRKSWEARVSYSLEVPPGRYYIYAKLLPGGDDSAEGMRGMRAYYTEYMKCGMGENCNSHKRVPLEVGAGESLTGITVGDWWANF